jgi:hypothetical protein
MSTGSSRPPAGSGPTGPSGPTGASGPTGPDVQRVTRHLTIPTPRDEDVMLISREDWNHLKGRVAGLPRGGEWMNEAAFMFIGIAISTFVTAITLWQAEEDLGSWVLPVLVVVAAASLVVGAAFLICHLLLKDREESMAAELVADMSGIYARYEGRSRAS